MRWSCLRIFNTNNLISAEYLLQQCVECLQCFSELVSSFILTINTETATCYNHVLQSNRTIFRAISEHFGNYLTVVL